MSSETVNQYIVKFAPANKLEIITYPYSPTVFEAFLKYEPDHEKLKDLKKLKEEYKERGIAVDKLYSNVSTMGTFLLIFLNAEAEDDIEKEFEALKSFSSYPYFLTPDGDHVDNIDKYSLILKEQETMKKIAFYCLYTMSKTELKAYDKWEEEVKEKQLQELIGCEQPGEASTLIREQNKKYADDLESELRLGLLRDLIDLTPSERFHFYTAVHPFKEERIKIGLEIAAKRLERVSFSYKIDRDTQKDLIKQDQKRMLALNRLRESDDNFEKAIKSNLNAEEIYPIYQDHHNKQIEFFKNASIGHKLVWHYYTSDLMAIFWLSLMKMIEYEINIKKCQSCEKYFVVTDRDSVKYGPCCPPSKRKGGRTKLEKEDHAGRMALYRDEIKLAQGKMTRDEYADRLKRFNNWRKRNGLTEYQPKIKQRPDDDFEW